ncbi:MAG: DUF362 domain-containing protein [Bacteroidota bacterium]
MEKFNVKHLPEWLKQLVRFFDKIKIPVKITFVVTGILATAWFLVRVIPKPSRAGYPCMQAAAPVMSGFVLYVISISTATFSINRVLQKFNKSRVFASLGLLVIASGLIGLSFVLNSSITTADDYDGDKFNPPDGANNPMGTPRGIYPGRVIWAWDKDATNENCTNSIGEKNNPNDDDGYFLPENADQDVINGMISNSLQQLTGTGNDSDAWDSLFVFHNREKGNGAVDYSNGEMIFIKINNGTSSWLADESSGYYYQSWAGNNRYGITETSPHVMHAVLKQLTEHGNVPQGNIIIGDPQSHVYKHAYDYLIADFPDVKYFDRYSDSHGRYYTGKIETEQIFYSDQADVMKDGYTDDFDDVVANADYMINLAALKGHERAGITLTAKNHFGTQCRGGASHLHPGLVWVEEGYTTPLLRTDYKQYRVQVDLMGHEKLGGNTMLFLVDGLWGGPEATMKPVKWKTAPFNNDWPNSIFISLDQVALESVCYDFLRTEFTAENHPGLAYPQYPGVDDYLHQAADPSNWPDGIQYDPEKDGIAITSLGVHEHWENATTKRYTRNMGGNQGIELVSIPASLVAEPDAVNTHTNNAIDFGCYPNPVRKLANFEFKIENKSEVVIKLLDLGGREVGKVFHGNKFPGEHHIQYSLNPGISPGNYLGTILVKSDNKIISEVVKIQVIQ